MPRKKQSDTRPVYPDEEVLSLRPTLHREYEEEEKKASSNQNSLLPVPSGKYKRNLLLPSSDSSKNTSSCHATPGSLFSKEDTPLHNRPVALRRKTSSFAFFYIIILMITVGVPVISVKMFLEPERPNIINEVLTVKEEIQIKNPASLEDSFLEKPSFDIPSLNISVREYSNRELTGVLLSAQFSEKLTLEAIEEAKIRTIPHLMEAYVFGLIHASTQVKLSLIEAIATLRDKRASPYLLEYLQDRKAEIRIAATKTLGKLGEKKTVGFIKARMNQEADFSVKEEMSKAIKEIQGLDG